MTLYSRPLGHAFHLGGDGLRGAERVRAGALEDRGDDRGLAAEIGVGAVILRAELDARHVRDADLAALRIGADDDVGELLGIGQATLRLDVELERAVALVIGRLAERAGGDLDVLCAQGGDDLAGREVQRGGAAGVNPHAH
jgi:hypothetical protein